MCERVCVCVRACVRTQRSKEELCGLLTDVCLGLGLWQHIQKYVRFCFLFFVAIFDFFGGFSLNDFFVDLRPLFPSWTCVCACMHPHIHFFPEASCVCVCVRVCCVCC